jgi:arylsulfate sulfotransferase
MRGYFNPQNGRLVLPMFGLYDNYSNTVVLRFGFTDGSFQQQQVAVSTPAWTDPCNVYKNFTPIQARTASTDLSYDYILIKSLCSTQTPVIIDTDGAVRWVGTRATVAFSSAFFANGIYIASNPPSSSNTTGLARIELDGTSTFLRDYTNWGVTSTNHHNIDPGKRGIILEVNTSGQVESMIMEVDAFGAVLRTWRLADIIRSAMIAGGDDPTQFVYPAPNDWFHNNAVTYRASDDSLIVSGREDFVICIDYQTGAIKWIFGDSNKKWYRFPSLRKYALVPQGSTLAPIGQHAVSITHDDNLLLFDDGLNSLFQMPPGISRTYSAARKYHIDKADLTATEVWNFVNGQTIFSPICSSVYEDAPLNYLIDYAQIGSFTSQSNAELLGLTAAGNKVFDYRYVQPSPCDTAWNAIPVHFENLAFTNVLVPNLVLDPGFETTTTGLWNTSGSAGRVNFNAHTGSYSMRATSGTDGAWQNITVTANKSYTLTAWGKKDSTLTNLMIFVKYGTTEIDRYFTSASYVQNSITFSPTTTSCTIGVWAWNGSGYGYADDFVLTSP